MAPAMCLSVIVAVIAFPLLRVVRPFWRHGTCLAPPALFSLVSSFPD
ncbi:hypothetical protein [Yoonia sp.]|nr:hypothetical protein [Yoonia sp.]MBE0413537.1 hypothetical protein [Yoonia sp.]